MIVLTRNFIPHEQFGHGIILNVMAAIYNLNLADLNRGTNLLQASNKAVLPLYGLPTWTVDLGHFDLHVDYQRSKRLLCAYCSTFVHLKHIF